MAAAAVPSERPLSVELRASIFNEIFKPTVEKMYVPLRSAACDAFEARKGAFASLGRCAKCNFKETEHKGTSNEMDTGKWVKVNGRFVRIDSGIPKHIVGGISQGSPVSSDHVTSTETYSCAGLDRGSSFELQRKNSGKLKRPSDLDGEEAANGRRGSTLSQASVGSMGGAKRTQILRGASALDMGSTENEDKLHSLRAVASEQVVNRKERADARSFVLGGLNHPETSNEIESDTISFDLGEEVDEQVEDEEEDEENMRRPSWAPPPLINLEEDQGLPPRRDSSAGLPPRRDSSSGRSLAARRLSWLNPRSGSSSASDNSGGSSPPGMGPKRSSLRMLASQIRAKMTKAKDTWEAKIGDSMPLCNRCGRPIEPSHKIVTAGMARAHEVCPRKEDSDRGPRNPRYMVQKAQDRIVLTFRCDKDTKQPYSFIFDLDKDSKLRALRTPNTAEMSLAYIADKASHASLERKFKPPKAREFDVSVRYTHTFDFHNPATNETISPAFDHVNKKVTVTKFCSANQVLHTILAVFSYDEESHVLSPLHLEFKFSMMPGAQPRMPTMFLTSRHAKGPQNILQRLEQRQQAKQQQGEIQEQTPAGSPADANLTSTQQVD